MVSTQLEKVLKSYWGYDSFRGLQKEVILSLLCNKDTIGLMPTGGGKSICYQLPSLVVDGWTLVVSPLISLIQDQEAQLLKRNIPVVALHSGLHSSQILEKQQNALHEKRGLLFVSPERLQSVAFVQFLGELNIKILAVDEAHCISQWGHDFRPAYLKIADIKEHLPRVTTIALTATATTKVLADIKSYLNIENAEVFQSSFARPNIRITAFETEQKWQVLLKLSKQERGSKIIYVRSRRRVMEISEYLNQRGVITLPYHAGLSSEHRQNYQSLWTSGNAECVVATSAFGMGVDKADVRLVVHMDFPPSIEEYYQEIGRAGRDGAPAQAILLYNNKDFTKLRKQIDDAFLSQEELRRIYSFLADYLDVPTGISMKQHLSFNLNAFCDQYDVDVYRTRLGLNWLQDLGYIDIKSGLLSASRVQITLDKNQLLDFLDEQPVIRSVIQTILRMYEGVFSSPVKIHEPEIAEISETPVEDVLSILSTLDQRGWLHYFPSQEGDGIMISTPREWKKRLVLDYKKYKRIYQGKVDRAKGLMSLVRDADCRQKFLLNYFDDYSVEACGNCDLCLQNEDYAESSNFMESLKLEILQRASHSKLSVADMILTFPLYRKRVILVCLNELMEDDKIRVKDRIIYVG